MTKIWGLFCLTVADVLLVRYLVDQKQKPSQCLQEMIDFFSDVTHWVTEWKCTLEKAVFKEQESREFPRLFQKKTVFFQKKLPIRDALKSAIRELPLSKEATDSFSHYLSVIGKATDQSTEECFRSIKRRLEEQLDDLKKQLPKTKKLVSAGVYSFSATVAILLL